MKTILITGASGGIGNAIALSVAKDNDFTTLVLQYNHNKKIVEDLKMTIESKYHKKVLPVFCDFSDLEQVEPFVLNIINKVGRIDALVNVAGISQDNLLVDETIASITKIMNINFNSLALISKVVCHNFMDGNGGNIINISSIWGKSGSANEVIYSASKGAVNSFTLALAKEMAYSKVRVNAIAPGSINTNMLKVYDEKTKKELIDETPLQRLGEPADIANLCCFLLDNKSSFITGQIITSDGGFAL